MSEQAKGPAEQPEPPSVRRLLVAGLAGALLWGLVFGWMDDDLWTLRNWAWALGTATVVIGMAFVITQRGK